MTKEELEKQTMEWKNNYILKLEKENAELKRQLNKNPCVRKDYYCSDCLKDIAKAKELLKKIYNFEEGIETEFPKFDLVKWSIETRDFLKDSEVEK